jgi:hypothetical protein
MTDQAASDHQFWARELIRLAVQQASKKGVPRHAMAQAMLLEAWMLFTGQGEEDAKKAVQGLYLTSIAKKYPGASPQGNAES